MEAKMNMRLYTEIESYVLFLTDMNMNFCTKIESYVVLSTYRPKPNKYFDSFQEAMNYADSIKKACWRNEGCGICKRVNNEWVFVMKCVKITNI